MGNNELRICGATIDCLTLAVTRVVAERDTALARAEKAELERDRKDLERRIRDAQADAQAAGGDEERVKVTPPQLPN